jgi:hypothetical protein
MPNRNWTRAIIVLFSALILLASFVTGQSIDEHGLQWISGASSAIILLLVIYDKWAWRWPLINKIAEMTGHPIIHGTWKASIEFEKDAKGQPGIITAYFSIYQTFSSVRVRGFFTTSQSSSLTAAIDNPQPGQYRLIFAYHGEAPHGKRNNNRPHDGMAILNIIGRPVESIEGSYFTDRGGAGSIVMKGHSTSLSESFNQASAKTY